MAVHIPELDPYGPSIRVPDRVDVRLTRRVQSVVDHREFQRLRRVRQLGPTHLVYPGAVHSRFEHSLGVYGQVSRFLVSLQRHPVFASSLSEADLLTVLMAGLLHDVGHYPFAHSLEALHRRGQETPRHERLGADIIRERLGAVLSRELKVEPERVARLIEKKPREQPTRIDRLLGTLISGAIDADKLDYLERDSVHLGVPYGTSFDAGRLVAALTLNEAEDAIAIAAPGKVSAEQFVFSRYLMFSEAYWHHAVRGASAMVEAALFDHVRRLPTATPVAPALLGLLLTRSDDELLADLRRDAPAGSVSARLLDGLTGDERRLHKRLVTYSRAYAEPEKREAYERLYRLDGAALDRVTDKMARAIAKATGRVVRQGDVLVDTPPHDKDRAESIDVRYLGVSGQGSYPLQELSAVVQGVHADFVQVVKKIRVFVSFELAAACRERRPELETALLEVVLG